MLIPIESAEDRRIADYCNLKERTLRGESIFIAEGDLVSERLIRSPFDVLSVLVTETACRRMSAVFAELPDTVPIYCLSEAEMLSTIVGFEFYQGVLVLGKRKKLPTALEGIAQQIQTADLSFKHNLTNQTLESQADKESTFENQIAEKKVFENQTSMKRKSDKKSFVWTVLPNATKPDNLGLAFRCSAALGADAVILGEECCDPFSRRAMRVSMGGVLQLPIFQAVDLTSEIALIRTQFDVDFVGTVLDRDAEFLHRQTEWSDRTAFLFGNEYDGLSEHWSACCNRKLLIPMKNGVDSLNLGVSVGIFLYEFQKAKGFPNPTFFPPLSDF